MWLTWRNFVINSIPSESNLETKKYNKPKQVSIYSFILAEKNIADKIIFQMFPYAKFKCPKITILIAFKGPNLF